MGFIDLAIIFGYLIGVTLFGVWFSGHQKTTEDYFVGNRSVPWWAIAMSIVATETSTITFISVPGIAFAKGGNFEFLQVAFGYMVGRVVISLIFIPLYFKGKLQSVYQLLGERFGTKVKMLASALFVMMRNTADGIRLLLTAIVLGAVYTAFQPDINPDFIIIACVVVLGIVMIIFTYYGGMEAVIWVEVVQLLIYLGGAAAAALVIVSKIDGGLTQVISIGEQFQKFNLIDWGFRQTNYNFPLPFISESVSFSLPFDFTKTFTFWAGLIGGCFLTMSTHGTDQYLVQRYLCTDKPKLAAIALLSSGAVILAQFIGFLFIGVLLFAFYQPFNLPEYATASGAFPFASSDRVFPDFITKHMPSGLSGLVVASIFAAALSSSLNSIAATAVNDLYKPFRSNMDDAHYLRISHLFTLIVGIIQIGVALAFMHQERSALDSALSVASLINGPILGVFLIGSFLQKATQKEALVAMTVSIAVMSLLIYFELVKRFGIYPQTTPIAWTWYVLIGSSTTFITAWLLILIRRR
jgi:solute:Na+ symporter, SSS family